MEECSNETCSFETFNNNEKCALHIEKQSYALDNAQPQLLSAFKALLVNFIIDRSLEYASFTDECSKENIREYLLSNNRETIRIYDEFLSDKVLVLPNILFPNRDSRDPFDYFKVLRLFKTLHFQDSEFNISYLEDIDCEILFQDCHFNDFWSISNSKIYPNVSGTLYQDCHFTGEVHISTVGSVEDKFTNSIFSDCIFLNTLYMTGVTFKSKVFKNTKGANQHAHAIKIESCAFEDDFIYNKDANGDLIISIKKSEFKSKFEFKNNVCSDIEINDSNYFQVVDFFKSTFGKFIVIKSIFTDFVGFEKAIFGNGIDNENIASSTTKFIYATFESFVNFRNTNFLCGLDIKNINLKEPPNFLNIKTNEKYTNRETYRIIKHSFDSIGNHIEGNKIYPCEMRKYQEELKGKPLDQEKVIFWINKFISNFGQSYKRPIIGIIITSIIYCLLISGYENNYLYSIYEPINNIMNLFFSFLNSLAAAIVPLKKFLKEGMELISLIFFIIYSALIWQVIVAVKRHTRR